MRIDAKGLYAVSAASGACALLFLVLGVAYFNAACLGLTCAAFAIWGRRLGKKSRDKAE